MNHPNTSIIKLPNDKFVLVSMIDIYTPPTWNLAIRDTIISAPCGIPRKRCYRFL